jgi:outer membrane protein W
MVVFPEFPEDAAFEAADEVPAEVLASDAAAFAVVAAAAVAAADDADFTVVAAAFAVVCTDDEDPLQEASVKHIQNPVNNATILLFIYFSSFDLNFA